MRIKLTTLLVLALAGFTLTARAQDVLPFPEPTSASVAGMTVKDSTVVLQK